MRSRTERSVWTALAVLALAAAAAAWWWSDAWLPQAGPWADTAWRKATRPGADSLPPGKQAAQAGASAPAAPPRKCLQGGRTVYTDQACPPGSQELLVDGAVTSLPAPSSR